MEADNLQYPIIDRCYGERCSAQILGGGSCWGTKGSADHTGESTARTADLEREQPEGSSGSGLRRLVFLTGKLGNATREIVPADDAGHEWRFPPQPPKGDGDKGDES